MAAGPVHLVKAVFSLFRRLRQIPGEIAEAHGELVTVRGRELVTNAEMSVRYIGLPDYFDFWMAQLFRPGYQTTERRRGWYWMTRAYFRSSDTSVDLQIAELPEPYYRSVRDGVLLMPCWLTQMTHLDQDWDRVVARFRKNTRTTDMRKVRKHQVSYRTTREPASVRAFYDQMYVPYSEERFGDLAVIEPYEELLADIQEDDGELLQIVHLDQVVGAAVLSRSDGVMDLLCLGLTPGLDRGVADAALSAIYLFSLQRAHERGCNEMSFQLTRPLLTDGIYHYKRKWGASVHDQWFESAFLLQPRTFSPPVKAFFAAHPMFVRGEGGLDGKVLLSEPVDSRSLQKLAQSYHSSGMRKLQFCGFHANPLEDEQKRNLTGVIWLDLSKAPDPAKAFCQAIP